MRWIRLDVFTLQEAQKVKQRANLVRSMDGDVIPVLTLPSTHTPLKVPEGFPGHNLKVLTFHLCILSIICHQVEFPATFSCPEDVRHMQILGDRQMQTLVGGKGCDPTYGSGASPLDFTFLFVLAFLNSYFVSIWNRMLGKCFFF